MARPLFYSCRRIRRGPRGGSPVVTTFRAIVNSRARAIDIARTESRNDILNEIDVVGVGIRHDRFAVVSKVATFVAGKGGHAIRG